MTYLEEKSINAVLTLSGLKSMCVEGSTLSIIPVSLLTSYSRRPNVYDHFLSACIKNNVREYTLNIASTLLTSGSRVGSSTRMRRRLSRN
jgi:hypothetical protein